MGEGDDELWMMDDGRWTMDDGRWAEDDSPWSIFCKNIQTKQYHYETHCYFSGKF